jgi:hypothetical protein
VFTQNTSTSLRRAGERVSLHWDPAHTFALAVAGGAARVAVSVDPAVEVAS